MRATVWSKKRAPDARKRASGAFILLHYIEDGCIELHHENVEKKAGRQEADALIHRIINLTDALDALAHDAVTHAHHHDRETDVRNETMRERTRKEGSYGIQQNGMGQEGERQHDTCRDAQLDEHQAQGRALAILGMVEMEHPTLPYHPDGDAVMRATVWSKKRAPDARKRASGAFILLHYIEDGCIELHHENVEKKAGRQEADALIHRIINLTDALDALAHDAVTHAHHHDRETDVRNETMRERTRKEGSYGIQQNGMGQEGERQHDTCRDAQLDEHQAQGRALAILGMVEMEHPTLPYHPDGDADEHQPYEPYRGEMVYKMARKPADALGAGKRMGERLGHRSCKQPRNQNHHYFGYSQQ